MPLPGKKCFIGLDSIKPIDELKHRFSLSLEYVHLSGQALLNYTVTPTETERCHVTCKHSQHDRIAGVWLVWKEKWAEIRSVILLFVYVSITAAWQQSGSLNKDRWLLGKSEKSASHSPLLRVSGYKTSSGKAPVRHVQAKESTLNHGG